MYAFACHPGPLLTLVAPIRARKRSSGSRFRRMIARGQSGPVTEVAPVLCAGANIVIGLIALGSVQLLLQGRLLPSPSPAR
jgi:hypothetical protein